MLYYTVVFEDRRNYKNGSTTQRLLPKPRLGITYTDLLKKKN